MCGTDCCKKRITNDCASTGRFIVSVCFVSVFWLTITNRLEENRKNPAAEKVTDSLICHYNKHNRTRASYNKVKGA